MSVRLSSQVELLSPRVNALFKPGDRNAVFRIAGHAAALEWITHWLPRRWDRAYAMSLGWKPGEYSDPGVFVRKIVDDLPFYESGAMIANAARTSAQISAAKGRVRIAVLVPIGHPLRQQESTAFRRIPAAESAAVAIAFRDASLRILASGITTITRGRGVGRLQLTTGVRRLGKSLSANRGKMLMPAASGQLASIASRYRSIRAPMESRFRMQQAQWRSGIEALRRDPNRVSRIAAGNRARQQRFRNRQRFRRLLQTSTPSQRRALIYRGM